MMSEQFDLVEAIDARDKGIRQVAENNERFLQTARQVARAQARIRGEITMDDVRKHCPLDPLHPNAWGAVFKTPDFEPTGHFRRSALVQGHGNLQRVWRLKP